MVNRGFFCQPEKADDLLPGMSAWTDCRESYWYYLVIQ